MSRQILKPRLKRLLGGLAVSVLTLILMLGLGEGYFRYVHLEPDGWDFTLMGQRWMSVCWKPETPVYFQYDNKQHSMTYRDHPWTDEMVQGKTKVMVVGDSYVAGFGICNAEDRFPNVLQKKLGDKFAVFNVGVGGWSTADELQYAPVYPYKPDIVILSYLPNDIEPEMVNIGHKVPFHVTKPDFIQAWPWNQSYLVDFVYWQIIYKRQTGAIAQNFTNSWFSSYSESEIWAAHKQEILGMIAWTKRIHAKLIVVLWPLFNDMAGSEKPLALVGNVFKENGALILNALDVFRNYPPESLVASSADAHPNEGAHKRVAQILYDLILRVMSQQEM